MHTATRVTDFENQIHPKNAHGVRRGTQASLKRANPYCRAQHRVRTRVGDRRWSERHGKVVTLDDAEIVRRRAGTSAGRLDDFRNEFIVARQPRSARSPQRNDRRTGHAQG